jgi:hypothetical protein
LAGREHRRGRVLKPEHLRPAKLVHSHRAHNVIN